MRSVFHWVGEHATKLAVTIRAFFYMGTLLQWWTLTVDQFTGIMAFVEAALYMFVESNTVSKVRVGERITEVREQERAAASGNQP